MSDLQTRLQRAADEAARHGRIPGPEAVIRRGRQRRRRLVGGTASLVVLVLVLVGALGTGRLASRQAPLAPTPTTAPTATAPTTTSVTRIPAVGKKVVPLDVQVHLGPSGFPDRWGMASDLTSQMGRCEGGTAQVRLWARCWGRPGCWPPRSHSQARTGSAGQTASGVKDGGSLSAGHGGPKDRLTLLQASQLGDPIAGKGELAVVGGPVTRQAVRLRILFRNGPPIDLAPLDAGPQFPVKFYAVFYLQPAKTAWMPQRVVAYDKAGHRIAECYATTREGDVCDRPPGAPQQP